jgi:hypothetical protein
MPDQPRFGRIPDSVRRRKTTRGRLTDIQRETIEAMRRAGAIVAVAHGLDEAIAQLEQWQLLRRDRNSTRAETKTGTSATATLDTRPFALAVNHQT